MCNCEEQLPKKPVGHLLVVSSAASFLFKKTYGNLSEASQ